MLPEMPELRRRLITLREDIYDWLSFDSKGHRLLANPSTTVVPLPVPADWKRHPALQNLERPGENKVFLVNPFADNTYEVIDEVMSQFALAKYKAIADICAAIGAKTLTATELRESDGKTTYTRKLGGNTKPVGAKGEYATELGSKVGQQLRATWNFQDHKMDAEEARQLLATRGLDGDPLVTGMVELRAADKLTGQSWTISLTNEASRDVAFAANLRTLLPPSPFTELTELSGELELHRNQTAKNRLEVTIEVDFYPLRLVRSRPADGGR